MNNPLQLIQMLKKSGNPQQMALNMLQQNCNGNPMLENLVNMANNGDGAGVEQVCRNIIKSRGMDPDELMKNFQGQFR